MPLARKRPHARSRVVLIERIFHEEARSHPSSMRCRCLTISRMKNKPPNWFWLSLRGWIPAFRKISSQILSNVQDSRKYGPNMTPKRDFQALHMSRKRTLIWRAKQSLSVIQCHCRDFTTNSPLPLDSNNYQLSEPSSHPEGRIQK